jgi:hypothetical protein
MIRRLIQTGTPAAALVFLSACTGVHVKSDVNTSLASTVQCHSFAWAGAFHGSSPLRNTIANPLNETRLRSAIASHLAAVGVQPATAEADCLVGYGIGASSVVEGAYPAWGGPWYGGWYGPYVYQEGIVAIDLYDARSRQPLWHASADQSLHGVSGAEAQKRIDRAVAAIFRKYPGATRKS